MEPKQAKPRSKHLYRNAICIIGFCLLLLLLFGSTIRPNINNFDNIGFYANLKPDAHSPIGKKSGLL